METRIESEELDNQFIQNEEVSEKKGIILAGGNNSRMQELSNKRAIAAMPIGGSYRSIDFALSNMSNSHVQTVAVLTQYSARS